MSTGLLIAAAACSSVREDDGVNDTRAPFEASVPADATAHDASTLSVELGTGSAFFAPLSNGDAVAMIRGKQGYQHVWISVRVRSVAQSAMVTISTRRQDGRWTGPDVTAAVSLDTVDGGSGTEKVGLTGLLDYGAIGQSIVVRVEVRAADGRHGADERAITVLPPVDGKCTLEAGTSTCSAVCGALACSICETGSATVGYLHEADASGPTVDSCNAIFEVNEVHDYACCCCR